MRLVLLGPPGSGKGTQGRLLTQKLSLPLFGMGDILREEVARATPLGNLVGPVIAQGGFPPSELVSRALFGRLGGLDNFILDGYPRDLLQAESLEKFLEEKASPLTHVIFFHLEPKVLLERLLARETCQACGAPHTRVSHRGEGGEPNKRIDGDAADFSHSLKVCSFCGGRVFVTRPDDRQDVAAERIRASQERDLVVLNYYKDRGILHQVDASQSVAQVTKCLLSLEGIKTPDVLETS